MFLFLDGMISYREGKPPQLPYSYELDALFSEGVGPDLSIHELEALQECFSGDLVISRMNDGGLHVKRQIIAYGPESAFRQAEDLSLALFAYLGLTTEVTHQPITH